MTRRDGDSGQPTQGVPAGADAPRPTEAQRRYLMRGLGQAGGKLSLFDEDGREVPRKTIEACIAHGWAERWIANPIKPDWLVCRLTPAGYRAIGAEPQAAGGDGGPPR
ncbi:MAG: hypothetical protein HC900_06325 [Methylacidiphilales bacterium]|nr:hypothetical protein [Candidatus Methylacidiphilales bacterium]